MKRFFQKKRILHAVVWILVYIYLVNLGDSLNQKYQIDYVTPILLFHFGIFLMIYSKLDHTLIDKQKNKEPNKQPYSILLYIPLVILAFIQFTTGLDEALSSSEVTFIILMMVGVGFIEEVLFRGFLLTSIKEKSNQKRAILISGLTFGLGHIVNLFRGYDYVQLISQIVLAIVIGIALAMLFVYTKSLLPGILFHITFNISGSLSTQNNTQEMALLFIMLFIAILYVYFLFLLLKPKSLKVNEHTMNTQKLTGDI